MKLGALVEGKVGKGRWIYIGLGLWRQLPAGTDGAYQLLANLICGLSFQPHERNHTDLIFAGSELTAAYLHGALERCRQILAAEARHVRRRRLRRGHSGCGGRCRCGNRGGGGSRERG